MKRNRINRNVGVLIAVVALAVLKAPAAGRLVVPSPAVVAMGEFPDWEDRAARLPIQNAGDAPLTLKRVMLTCSCMRLDAFPKTLAPGERGEVVVTIQGKAVFGGFDRVFYILSDDPQNPQAKVTLTGKTVPLFTVTCDVPTMLDKVDAGHVWTGRYTVAASTPGVYLEAPRALNMGATCEFAIRTNRQEKMSYEVTHVVTFQEAERLESTLVFPVAGGVTGGAQPPQGGYPPVRLRVVALHRQRVRALPDTLRITGAVKPVRRRILLRIEDEAALEIAHLRCSSDVEGITLTPSKSVSGKGLYVDATIGAEALRTLKSKGGATLRFHYKQWPAAEIKVLFSE
jgi:hypothetical protein